MGRRVKGDFIVKKKLFEHAPLGTEIFLLFGSDGTAKTRPASGLPLPLWPDGRWCPEVAMYLKKLFGTNLSLYDRGGTLGAYASLISHLIRFCWRKGVAFHCLTDDLFCKLIEELKDATELRSGAWERKRSARTVVRIGRRCLDFLEFIGELHGIDGFVSQEGCIQAWKKSSVQKERKGRQRRVLTYWYHSSFPPLSPQHKRHLIKQDYIDLLRRAAVTLSPSPFMRQRRLVLLRLLEATGARRSEIARLTVTDVREAMRMQRPFLKLVTAKKGDNSSAQKFRLVPIEHHELQLLSDYIEYHREEVMERCNATMNDHDILLVSYNTSKPLTPSTISLELRYMRMKAGITGKAHPHLFRHRFVTYSLVRLIKAYKLKNRSEFELKFRLDGFKKEVAELTGHSSIESMEDYIDWAFIELFAFDDSAPTTVDLAVLAGSIRSSIPELESLLDTLPPEEFKRILRSRMNSVIRDLDGCAARANKV